MIMTVLVIRMIRTIIIITKIKTITAIMVALLWKIMDSRSIAPASSELSMGAKTFEAQCKK